MRSLKLDSIKESEWQQLLKGGGNEARVVPSGLLSDRLAAEPVPSLSVMRVPALLIPFELQIVVSTLRLGWSDKRSCSDMSEFTDFLDLGRLSRRSFNSRTCHGTCGSQCQWRA